MLGFVRFMLSAKTEPQCFPGLIIVLNGVYSLLTANLINCKHAVGPFLHFEGNVVPSLHPATGFDPSLSWLIKQLGKAACYLLIPSIHDPFIVVQTN